MPAGPRRIFAHVLFLTLLAVLPIAALLGYSLWKGYRHDEELIAASLRTLGENGARHLHTFLANTGNLFQRLAASPPLHGPDESARDAYLSEFSGRHPEFVNALLTDPAGNVRAAARFRGAYPEVSLLTDPTLRPLLTGRGPALSNGFLGTISRRWTCFFVVPLRDPAGGRTGSFVVPLDTATLSPIVLDLTGAAGEGVSVLDGAGRILMDSSDPAGQIGRIVADFDTLQQRSAGGRIVQRFTGFGGEPLTVFLRPLPETPWFVATYLPTAVALDAPRRLLMRNLGLGLLGLALMLVLVRRQTGSITRPILQLAKTARTVESGQRDVRAPEEGPAEIRETAHAFNAMLATQAAAEQALRESRQRLELALNGADLGLWDWRVDSNAIDVNESWTRMLGYGPDELTPVYGLWESMLHPDDRAGVLARLDDHLEGRTDRFEAEYRLRSKSGEWIWILDRGRVVERDAAGKPLRAAGTHLNVTPRKQAEADQAALTRKLLETQKLESLGLLAGGIAHDFNNLLTGILGHASLARYELPDGSSATESLAQIEQTAMRAAELCQQMLAYSGKGRFLVQRIDLNELIRDTTQLLEISIKKSATLRFDLAPALPIVDADATQLRQVVMNLVINASEAMNGQFGQITLATALLHATPAYIATLQAGAELAPGDYVVLEISDTGCGMSRETVAHIFDPFFTTKFTGRGLGLAAVLGIVRGHRGALKVYSELGRGTTFKILLPAAEGASERLPPPPAEATDWRGAGHILVIDDEETVRNVLAHSLQTLGFGVDLAADGMEGLQLFRHEPARYAVVLLDLTMPGLDGEAVFRELRLLRPAVKVILTSGFNHQEAVNRFVGKELAGFVQKPFTFEQLAAAVRRALETPSRVDPL